MGIRVPHTMTPPIMLTDSGSNNPLQAPQTDDLSTVSNASQLQYYLRFNCYCAATILDHNCLCRRCVDLHGANPTHTEVNTLRDPDDAARYPMFRYSIDTNQLHIRDYGFGLGGYCPVKVVPHFVRLSTRLTVAGVKK